MDPIVNIYVEFHDDEDKTGEAVHVHDRASMDENQAKELHDFDAVQKGSDNSSAFDRKDETQIQFVGHVNRDA